MIWDVSELGLVGLDLDESALWDVVLENDLNFLPLGAHQIVEDPMRDEHGPLLSRELLNPNIGRERGKAVN